MSRKAKKQENEKLYKPNNEAEDKKIIIKNKKRKTSLHCREQNSPTLTYTPVKK